MEVILSIWLYHPNNYYAVYAAGKIMPTSEFNQMLTLLKKLGEEFQENPREYFHENDIHAKFWNLGKGKFGTAKTNDDKPEEAITIDLFRHEYNTIWRYSRKGDNKSQDFNGSFKRRYWGESGESGESEEKENSKTGCFDFALLNDRFVRNHDEFTVINKEEPLRNALRKLDLKNPTNLDKRPVKNKAVLVGVEFKMIHFGQVKKVTNGVFESFIDGMNADCRKLRLEGVPYAFSVGFSHGELGSDNNVLKKMTACLDQFCDVSPDSKFRILIFTPTKFYQVSTRGSKITPKEALAKEMSITTP